MVVTQDFFKEDIWRWMGVTQDFCKEDIRRRLGPFWLLHHHRSKELSLSRVRSTICNPCQRRNQIHSKHFLFVKRYLLSSVVCFLHTCLSSKTPDFVFLGLSRMSSDSKSTAQYLMQPLPPQAVSRKFYRRILPGLVLLVFSCLALAPIKAYSKHHCAQCEERIHREILPTLLHHPLQYDDPVFVNPA